MWDLLSSTKRVLLPLMWLPPTTFKRLPSDRYGLYYWGSKHLVKVVPWVYPSVVIFGTILPWKYTFLNRGSELGRHSLQTKQEFCWVPSPVGPGVVKSLVSMWNTFKWTSEMVWRGPTPGDHGWSRTNVEKWHPTPKGFVLSFPYPSLISRQFSDVRI